MGISALKIVKLFYSECCNNDEEWRTVALEAGQALMPKNSPIPDQ